MYYYNDMRNFVKDEKSSEEAKFEKFDEYDDMMYYTDCVLCRVRKAKEHAEELHERCVRLRTKLESVGSFDYERMGKLGCKVSSSGGCDTGSKVVNLIDLEDQYKDALELVESEKSAVRDILKECGTLTDVERSVLYYRWDTTPSRQFGEIADLVGLKNHDSAWYYYKKAYTRFAMWLMTTDYILPHVA